MDPPDRRNPGFHHRIAESGKSTFIGHIFFDCIERGHHPGPVPVFQSTPNFRLLGRSPIVQDRTRSLRHRSLPDRIRRGLFSLVGRTLSQPADRHGFHITPFRHGFFHSKHIRRQHSFGDIFYGIDVLNVTALAEEGRRLGSFYVLRGKYHDIVDNNDSIHAALPPSSSPQAGMTMVKQTNVERRATILSVSRLPFRKGFLWGIGCISGTTVYRSFCRT